VSLVILTLRNTYQGKQLSSQKLTEEDLVNSFGSPFNCHLQLQQGIFHTHTSDQLRYQIHLLWALKQVKSFRKSEIKTSLFYIDYSKSNMQCINWWNLCNLLLCYHICLVPLSSVFSHSNWTEVKPPVQLLETCIQKHRISNLHSYVTIERLGTKCFCCGWWHNHS
jgi:hypothetical protein